MQSCPRKNVFIRQIVKKPHRSNEREGDGRSLGGTVVYLLTCWSVGMTQPCDPRAFNTKSGLMTSSPSKQPVFRATNKIYIL